ncbi:DUF411 domain-containing protein [Arcobacter cloacae]|uniref:DUF411 domain-containing protein n=1 Tax=Arcobacter cloacae TaxID=1054034 RepID=A0A4Q0ZIR7_9BACT|nr:DUF411 domain-containing protein [Arcobacter cloacae]RXJ85790.1 hypothetical protein CRU90_00575 [Arcobacter cloacae]
MKKILFLLSLGLLLFANENKMQIFQPITSTCPISWLNEMKTIASEVEIVTVHSNKKIKKDVGIPLQIQSCNTSFFNDYVFEGNVPLLAIKDFFKEIPKNSIGLALPSYENDKEEKTVFVIYENKTYKEFGKYK